MTFPTPELSDTRWFETHLAHRAALDALGRANSELFKRACEDRTRAETAEAERDTWLKEAEERANACSLIMRERDAALFSHQMAAQTAASEHAARFAAESLAADLAVKLERAVEVMKPFAETVEVDIGSDETDEDIFQQAHHNRAPQITVGHFRAIRSFIKDNSPDVALPSPRSEGA